MLLDKQNYIRLDTQCGDTFMLKSCLYEYHTHIPLEREDKAVEVGYNFRQRS
jgi:hypothetical protein